MSRIHTVVKKNPGGTAEWQPDAAVIAGRQVKDYEQEVALSTASARSVSGQEQEITITTVGARAVLNHDEELAVSTATGRSISTVDSELSSWRTAKDTWVDAAAACLSGDANHNTEELRYDGVAATAKEMLIAFDTGSIGSSAEVVSATLHLHYLNDQVAGGNVTVHSIADGAEGWNESTVSCSTRPSAVTQLESVASPAGASLLSVPLGTSALDRLNARLGVGPTTFLIRPVAASTDARRIKSSDQRSTDLDGTNDFWEITDALQSGLDLSGDLTVEAWIKPDDVTGAFRVIAEKTQSGGGNANLSYAFQIQDGDKLRFYYRANNANNSVVSNVVTFGTDWQHVAVTRSGAAFTFYRDGVEIGTPTGIANAISNSLAPFRVGSSGPGLTANLFDGRIGIVRVWSVARTAGEIVGNQTALLGGTAPAGLVSEWRFAADGTDAASGNDLTANGGVGFTTDAPFTYGPRLDATLRLVS